MEHERRVASDNPLLSSMIVVCALLGFFVLMLLSAGVVSWMFGGDTEQAALPDRPPAGAAGQEVVPATLEEVDVMLRDRLGAALEPERPNVVGNFNYDVKDRTAHLYGAVDTQADRIYLEEIARAVEGIRGVKNNIDLKDIDPFTGRGTAPLPTG